MNATENIRILRETKVTITIHSATIVSNIA